MEEQMVIISYMKNQIKNRSKVFKIKNTVIENNTDFDGLISRRDTGQERISEPEDRSTEIFPIEMQGDECVF